MMGDGTKWEIKVKLNPKDTTSAQVVAQMDELFGINAQARQEGLTQVSQFLTKKEKVKYFWL
jgi:hypothetical protein